MRAAIGRRRPGGEAIIKIEDALARGWIVSVDLICGLPGQSLAGFLDGLRTLIGIGVDGFSLYELLIYPQNHRWAESYGLTSRRAFTQLLDVPGRRNPFGASRLSQEPVQPLGEQP